jgi:hypothetical protein
MQMAYDGDGYGGLFGGGGVKERNVFGRLAVAWPAKNLEHGHIAKRLRRALEGQLQSISEPWLSVSCRIYLCFSLSNKP